MNILQPNSADVQSIVVTPRKERGDSYTLTVVEDGTQAAQTVTGTATFSGSFMTFTGVINAKVNRTYALKIATNTGVEIYRGKAVASAATQPLKNSIYE
jgi:hypothetical protein